MPVTADLLRLVPLFAGMTDRSFEAIASVAADVAFEEATTSSARVRPDRFFIIVSGRARVDRDGSTIRSSGRATPRRDRPDRRESADRDRHGPRADRA